MGLMVNALLVHRKISSCGLADFDFCQALSLVGLFLIIEVLCFGCKFDQPVDRREFPFLILVSSVEDYSYNVEDTLKKYSVYDAKELGRNTEVNFSCFMSNLWSIEGDTIKASKYLLRALALDRGVVCDRVIAPIVAYLDDERPHRSYNMPSLLITNFGLFLDATSMCGLLDSMSSESKQSYELILRIRYLSLLDQWYRVPERDYNQVVQDSLDIYCRRELDRLYDSQPIPTDILEVQSVIYVVLLHSKDCLWTKKWLQRYYRLYEKSKFMEKHLSHFIWRSDCSSLEEIREQSLNLLGEVRNIEDDINSVKRD